MRKIFIISLIVFLIFSTAIIKNSTKRIDDEIFIIKGNLRNLENTTIKQPKIQETSTLRLFSCIYNKFSKDPICKGGFNEEILPTLNRRMVLPLFIPVIALISSLLFIKTSGRIYYSKVSIFAYSFLVLLYAELTIRYTGINEIIKKKNKKMRILKYMMNISIILKNLKRIMVNALLY